MNYYSPKEIASVFASTGIEKARLPISKFIVLAILGGVFVAFGGLLSVIVAGGIPGIGVENPGLVKLLAGVVFPVGLIMVSVAGADLFTSDCAGMTLPCLQKDIKVTVLLKIWVLSYIFNFVGTQIVAYFMANATELVTHSPYLEYLHSYTGHKVDQEFYPAFIKGIGANWLVCLGSWMGYAGKDIMSKCIGIWVPVMLFVTLGFEHSIANMFFVPAAIYSGADITWGAFLWQNLFPATLGNIVGGAVFVGYLYWFVYLRGSKTESFPH